MVRVFSRRTLVLAAATASLVAGGVGAVVVSRDDNAGTVDTLVAEPGTSSSATAAASSPATSPEPTDYPLPTPPADPTDGPHPQIVPGTKTASISFFNHDPTYSVVIWIDDEPHGPFAPWQQTGVIRQETHAGMVFRFVFPNRHQCDTANRPLSAPIEGRWSLGVERIYLDHGCATLAVWGSEPGTPTRWSEQPPPTSRPSPIPSPTPTPEPTSSDSPTPEPSATSS